MSQEEGGVSEFYPFDDEL